MEKPRAQPRPRFGLPRWRRNALDGHPIVIRPRPVGEGIAASHPARLPGHVQFKREILPGEKGRQRFLIVRHQIKRFDALALLHNTVNFKFAHAVPGPGGNLPLLPFFGRLQAQGKQFRILPLLADGQGQPLRQLNSQEHQLSQHPGRQQHGQYGEEVNQ